MTTTHPLQVEQDRALMQVKAPTRDEIISAAEVLRRACGTFEPSTATTARALVGELRDLLTEEYVDNEDRLVLVEDFGRYAQSLVKSLGAE